jgi:hypothetical protein
MQVARIPVSKADHDARVAAILSFLVCGLGHLYSGHIVKAIGLFASYTGFILVIGILMYGAGVAELGGLVMTLFLIGSAVAALAVWAYAIVDAFRTTQASRKEMAT